jgi:hypothetical protein
VRRLQDGAQTPLTEASLSGVDVVILDWLSRDYSSKEIEEFRRWFQKGHGFLTMSGYSDDYPASRPNAFLDLVGFSLSSSVTVGIAPDQEVKTFAAHPLGEGLRSVSFLGGCDVSTVKAAPAPAKQGTFATLAGKTVGTWYESGDATNSRAVVWGDEWISFDSEWSKFPDVPRLWSNMMRYLAPQCKVPPPVR